MKSFSLKPFFFGIVSSSLFFLNYSVANIFAQHLKLLC
jgi:hypothetical protein